MNEGIKNLIKYIDVKKISRDFYCDWNQLSEIGKIALLKEIIIGYDSKGALEEKLESLGIYEYYLKKIQRLEKGGIINE